MLHTADTRLSEPVREMPEVWAIIPNNLALTHVSEDDFLQENDLPFVTSKGVPCYNY